MNKQVSTDNAGNSSLSKQPFRQGKGEIIIINSNEIAYCGNMI